MMIISVQTCSVIWCEKSFKKHYGKKGQAKEDEMGRKCSMNEDEEVHM
jgi:hypothetical protein